MQWTYGQLVLWLKWYSSKRNEDNADYLELLEESTQYYVTLPKLTSGVYEIPRIREICRWAVSKTTYFALLELYLLNGKQLLGMSPSPTKKGIRSLASLVCRNSYWDALTVTSQQTERENNPGSNLEVSISTTLKISRTLYCLHPFKHSVL